ncbi:MAG: PLP-dependent transferase [Hyphomicrobiaceae bacterium]|nr:MAG: PLP-dependent transferase [Hyphomicrobiaceae bacterium]
MPVLRAATLPPRYRMPAPGSVMPCSALIEMLCRRSMGVASRAHGGDTRPGLLPLWRVLVEAGRRQVKHTHTAALPRNEKEPDAVSEREKTRLVHASRGKIIGEVGTVNPPVVRCSTVLYKDLATRQAVRDRRAAGERCFSYGALGTPTTYALEDAINEIEGGSRTMLFPTGLAAVAHPFLSLLLPGDHVLLAETVYGPARAVAVNYLTKRNINCEFYAGGHEEVKKRLKPNTRMVYLDNPGSIIYDVQDLPALAALLKGRETFLVVDNTWGSPGMYKPLALGADVSIIALTKYVGGHSDLVLGSVSGGPRTADRLWKDANTLGQSVSPDDAYSALKGLRTAAARLAMHRQHTAEVIAWLERQPQVKRILYPAHPKDPGHALWKRDFKGANGLFSIELADRYKQADADRVVDALRLFGIGASWGGYESLALTYPIVHGWKGGALIRFHIGLEDPADMIEDLAKGLAVL